MEANDYTFSIDFITIEMAKLISGLKNNFKINLPLYLNFIFLKGGLLNDIIVNIQNKINNQDSKQLFMYGIVSFS